MPNNQPSPKLLPCPFCGGEAVEMITTQRDFYPSSHVECLGCSASIKKYPSVIVAEKKWNHRHQGEPNEDL